ncbi:glycosyltransferase [uncultured Croceitalea sp.]|uniref:glycosyltransferase n=1 Tax=uncultured Croceitalea sp. TaxID=1798908 RepID=UPI0033060CE3
MYSLITTVFNEEKSIIEFIESLNSQTVYPNEFIIVDGGSKDKTVQFLEENICAEIPFRIIIDKKCSKKFSKGPIAKGRNVAISNAKYQNILVTDAGCILDKNWVEQMIFSFENKKADIVSGWYKARVTNDFQKEIANIFCPAIDKVNKKTFLPSSRSLGFKKKLWTQVKGYPEESYTAEDTLFDIRIFKIAENIIFNEKAFVYWNIPENIEELKQKLYQYGYGEGQQKIFLIKNFLKVVSLLFFPVLVLAVFFGKKNKRVFTFYYYFSKGFLKGLFN